MVLFNVVDSDVVWRVPSSLSKCAAEGKGTERTSIGSEAKGNTLTDATGSTGDESNLGEREG